MSFVVFFCLDGAGQVLLAQRRKKAGEPEAYWYSGAGTIEEGETPDDACRREIIEEYGVTTTPIFLGERNGFLDSARGRQRWTCYDYVTFLEMPAKNVAREENQRIMWADARRPDTWPTPWHPYFADFLRANYGRITELIPIRPAPIVR